MMLIVVKSDDVRSERKAKARCGRLTRSQQSRPFVFRSTLAFCERFKYDMEINGKVMK